MVNGNLNHIRHSSEVLFLSNGASSKTLDSTFGKPWLVSLPDLTGTVPVTLAYANNGKAIDAASFDTKRHKGKMNVAFVDGHDDTISIAAADLAKVYLIPPQ